MSLCVCVHVCTCACRCVSTENKSKGALTWDPVERHPEVLVGAVSVLGPRQQIDGTLVLQHELHEGPRDSHVCGAEVDGQVVGWGRLVHKCPQHERKKRV